MIDSSSTKRRSTSELDRFSHDFVPKLFCLVEKEKRELKKCLLTKHPPGFPRGKGDVSFQVVRWNEDLLRFKTVV
jgi:hypothetical protein